MPCILDIAFIPHIVRDIAAHLSIADVKRCSLTGPELYEAFSPFLGTSLTISRDIEAMYRQRILTMVLVKRGRFIRALFIDTIDLPLNVLQNVTNQCPAVTRFHSNVLAVPLNRRVQATFDYLARLSALERVSFTIHDLFVAFQDRLVPSLLRLTMVTDLRLEKGTWSSQGVLDLLEQLPRLQVFHLQAQKMVLNHAVEVFNRSDRQYPNLNELALGSSSVKGNSGPSMESFLLPLWQKCPHLETLWICGSSYTVARSTLPPLCDFLRQTSCSSSASASSASFPKIRNIRLFNDRYPHEAIAEIVDALPNGQLRQWELLSSISPWDAVPVHSWGERLVQNHFSSLEHVELTRGTLYNEDCRHTWVPTLLESCPRLRVLRAPAKVGMRGTGHVQRMISLDIRAAVQVTWACRDLEELDIPIVGACLTWPHDRCWDYISNRYLPQGQHDSLCESYHRRFFCQLSRCRKMRRFSMGYNDRQGLVDNFPDETCHSLLNHDDCAPYTQSDDALPWTLGSGLEFLETSWKQLEYLGLAWTTHRAGMDELQWMLQHWPRLKQIDGFWRVCDYVDNIDHILFMDMHHPDVKLHNIVPRCGTKDP